MIQITYKVGKECYVFADFPETDAEEAHWRGLVRQTKYLHSISRSGLWILAEFKMNGRNVVVTSVNDKVDLNERDLTWLRTAIQSCQRDGCKKNILEN